MNTEQRFQSRISGRRENAAGGIILLVIGSFLLARQMGVQLPGWLFTWPMIPIVVGIFVGIKTKFRDFGWILLIGVGVFFLMEKIQAWPVKEYILPMAVIGVGLAIVLNAMFRKPKTVSTEEGVAADGSQLYSVPNGTTEDVMEVISVFGSAKRVILSKNFKGGEVISVFGSAEINLTNADFTGTLVLEVVQVFGGTKLIVPPHWEVQSKTAAIFGGIDDKRAPHGTKHPEKIVIIDGATFFGGLTITSY
jgi:predicted membrane protein